MINIIKLNLFLIFILIFSERLLAKTIWLEESPLNYEIYDLILDDGLMLFNSSDIYIHNNVLLLPFNASISALEINLNYDKRDKSFKGQLNGKEITLSLQEQSNEINWNVSILISDNQLFIDTQTLGYLIDADITVDNPNLTVLLAPKTQPFPLQSRIARAQREVFKPTKMTDLGYSFIINDQYRAFTPPSGNISFAVTASDTDDNYNVNLNTFNDILFHSANISIAQTNTGSLKKRLTLSRSKLNPTEKLIANINRYSFGDVSASNTRSGSSYTGVGLVFTSFKERYDNSFGKITLDEYATANWQAELYQNGFLIDTGVVDENGRIVFKDVETNYGSNRFEIKTYGSFGEQQTIVRDVLVGQNLLKPGEIKYKGGVFDTNHSLLNSNNVLNNDIDFAPAGFIQGEYGLNNKTSLGLSLFLEKDLENNNSAEEAIVSVTRQLPSALLNLNLKVQEAHSYNLDSNLTGAIGRWTHYQLGMSYSDNYQVLGTNEKIPDKLGFSGSLNGRIGSLGYGISGSTNASSQLQNETSFDSKQNHLTGRISWRYKKVSFSNAVNWSQTKNNDIGNTSVVDQISASIPITKNLNFRASGKFDFSNNRSGGKFKSINSTLNWRISNRLNTNMSINYQSDDKYRISNFLSWRRDDYNLILGTNYSDDSRWQISLGVNFALDYDYHNQIFNLKNTYSPATGTLDLFTFIDNNKNALYDEYDDALVSVEFGSYPYWKNIQTNKFGTAYLPGTSANSPVKVYFETDNTHSPQLKAIHENFRFYTHPGGVISLDIPFNYATEVEGKIEIAEASASAKFIPMQILNTHNKLIQQVTADLDNEYYFSKMWPGEYTLQIDPKYLKNKGLKSAPKQIHLELNGAVEYYTATDFTLTPIKTNTTDAINELAIETKAKLTTIINTKIDAPIHHSDNKALIPAIQMKPIKIAVKSQLMPNEIKTLNNNLFSIQVGAYSKVNYCIEKINELTLLKLRNTFNRHENDFCKVYIGQYSDRIEAQTQMENLPESIKGIGFIVQL